MLADTDAVMADPTAKRCTDRALSSATRMWRMIEDVLAYASLGGHPSFDPVDLGAVVAQVVEDVSTSITTAQATVDVGPLPMVYGDATQLRVLIQNMVSNSLKFRDRDRACHIAIPGGGTTMRITLPRSLR